MLDDLRTLITSDGTVSGLIGARMYPNRIPQDKALPAVAYQLISQPHIYAHAEGDVGLHRARVQITVQATSYSSLRSVIEAVTDVVSGYRGTTGSTWFNAIFVDNTPDEWSESFERPTGRVDLIIWHRASS